MYITQAIIIFLIIVIIIQIHKNMQINYVNIKNNNNIEKVSKKVLIENLRQAAYLSKIKDSSELNTYILSIINIPNENYKTSELIKKLIEYLETNDTDEVIDYQFILESLNKSAKELFYNETCPEESVNYYINNIKPEMLIY